MRYGADHGGPVVNVAAQARLHVVEGERRGADLGRAAQLDRCGVWISTEPLGRLGEALERRGDPAREQEGRWC